MPHPRVAALGQCAADTLCIVPRLPAPDTKLEVREFLACAGGPAATAAATVRRLGGQAAFIGHVGADDAGVFVRGALDALGVDTTFLRTRSRASSHRAFVMVDGSTGARTIVWTTGSVGRLRARDVPADLIRSVDGVLLDSVHLEAGGAAARIARNAGVQVFLDGGTARDGVERVLRRTDVCFATRAFLRDVTGVRDLRAALRTLARSGPRITGVTLGEEGAIGYDAAADAYAASAAFDVRVVDTTGAGDVFHGAIAFAVLSGQTLPDALAFANAAAALSCTAPGAQGALPTGREVLRLVRAQRPAHARTRDGTRPADGARGRPPRPAPGATARRGGTAREASPIRSPRARRRSPTR
jgi:sulfofructose kinase